MMWSTGESRKRSFWPRCHGPKEHAFVVNLCHPFPPSRGERTSRRIAPNDRLGPLAQPARQVSYRLKLAPSSVERRTADYGGCGPYCSSAGQYALAPATVAPQVRCRVDRLGGKTAGAVERPPPR